MTIGIDIGGTNIKGVLINGNLSAGKAGKKVIAKIKILTRSKTNQKIIFGQIFKCIEKLIQKSKNVGRPTSYIQGIGIGVAGPVDFENQKALNPPNVTGLKNLELGKIIEKKFKIKTIIDNDVHCLAFAEALLGAGKNKKMVVGLGIGTGVGGGIVIDKKIIYGKSGTAGEMGHMMIVYPERSRGEKARKCNCGSRGCLEAYINEKGIQKTAKEIFGREINTIKLYEMTKKRDKKAIKVWEITGRHLGLGLANIVDTLNPDIIVVGGGIAGAGELLLNPARKEMRKNILSPEAKNTPVVRAKLGEYAGAIGAGLLLNKRA